MQPDSRRMKKFGLYSCTCHAGISAHFGPPVIHDLGSTPGSMNALAGWGGVACAADRCAMPARVAISIGWSTGPVLVFPPPARIVLALNRQTVESRPFDSQIEPCITRNASPPGP